MQPTGKGGRKNYQHICGEFRLRARNTDFRTFPFSNQADENAFEKMPHFQNVSSWDFLLRMSFCFQGLYNQKLCESLIRQDSQIMSDGFENTDHLELETKAKISLIALDTAAWK